MLNKYDKKLGCLGYIDLHTSIQMSHDEIIICHQSDEFETDGHIHCETLNRGMEELVKIYLERLIWKYEELISGETS